MPWNDITLVTGLTRYPRQAGCMGKKQQQHSLITWLAGWVMNMYLSYKRTATLSKLLLDTLPYKAVLVRPPHTEDQMQFKIPQVLIKTLANLKAKGK